MNKNTKGIVTVIAVIAIVGGGWYLTRNKNRQYARVIIEAGKASNYAVLITFDKSFLKAWSKAVRGNDTTFEYNGKNYNTQGGKVAQ
jgi:uncharacterized protein YxeA